MGHIFIAVNGDNVGESIGNAIISDNHDELSRVSGSIKSAHQMLDQWVQSKGGKVIVSSGDEGIYSIPQEASNELDTIKQKYASMANTSLTIGVGSTMSEASKALIYGKMNNKDQVVHYEPAVDDYISNDGEAQAQEQDMEDQLPSEQDVINSGDDTEEGMEGVDDGQGVEEGQGVDGDGEEDNSEIPGEENDPNVEFSQDGEDGLDQDGSMADEDQDGIVDEEQQDDMSADPAAQQGAIPPKKQNPAAIQAPGKAAPAAPKGLPGKAAPQAIPAVGEESLEEEGSEDDSQPSHEQGMDEEENFAHDAEENAEDELDGDNVEADEEQAAFGEESDENTEQQAGDGNMDAEFDPAAQDNGEVDADLSDVDDEDGVNQAADVGVDEEGMGGFGDDSAEDDGIQTLGDDEVDQGANPEEQDGIMSEMLHANMGDEQSEDSDDEIKQDIIESLMQFKQHKAHLEEMKQTNPELYQAQMVILRTMIQMAKKLQMNPERGMAEKSMSQDTQEAFPSAEDDQQADPAEMNPMLGKSESLKKARVDEGKSVSQKQTDRKDRNSRTKFPAGRPAGFHVESGKTIRARKPGEGDKVIGVPKKITKTAESVMNKAKVDAGKTDNQKQIARAGRNIRVKDQETKKIVGAPKVKDPLQTKQIVKKETEVKKQ